MQSKELHLHRDFMAATHKNKQVIPPLSPLLGRCPEIGVAEPGSHGQESSVGKSLRSWKADHLQSQGALRAEGVQGAIP